MAESPGHDAPVRWRREFLFAGARFDAHGGEWFAGLVIGKRRRRRLILDESRLGEFAIPLSDPLDPSADEVVLTSQQIERLSVELKRVVLPYPDGNVTTPMPSCV